jgi:hypothetical protein
MKFPSIAISLTLVSSLLGLSAPSQAAPETRIYDHEGAKLSAGTKLEPGHTQHLVTLLKPPEIKNGIRHVEYKLSSSDGREFTAIHHREDGRDGVSGHIEVRDAKSGKTVKWQLYPAGFRQVCHDGTAIDVVAANQGRQVYMSHPGEKTLVMDYDAAKAPADRERLEAAASVVVHKWCPMDEAHRSALAAAHQAGNADLGVSEKSFLSFFTHTIPSFFSSIGKKMCSMPAAGKTAVCATGGAVAGLGTAVAIVSATDGAAKTAAKAAGTSVGMAAFGGCGTAFATQCH